MNLIECYQKNSWWYKSNPLGKKVVGILWHETAGGNPYLKRYVQPYETDENYAEMMKLLGKNQYNNDWNHIEHKAGLNAWIGKLADGTIATVLAGEDLRHPSGCGRDVKGSCNGYLPKNGQMYYTDELWYQFEVCDDSYKSKEYFEAVYKEACELSAYICKKYNIDPLGKVKYGDQEVPTIICHQDSYKLKLGNDHGDIYGWFKKFGKSMEDVRNDINKILKGTEDKKDETAVDDKDKNKTAVQVGDLVKIVGPNATYYGTKTKIPTRILNKCWYVKSINNDRVVIDKSEDGKDSICSAVKLSDLVVVKSAKEPEEEKKEDIKPIKLEIEKGCLVQILGKNYYNSSVKIPDRILKKNWYVESISGDRVVINMSEDEKDYIMSPIHKNDLLVLKAPKVDEEIKVGSLVKIIGVNYYNVSTKIPSWVLKNNWYVKSIKGDRVIIDKSEDGKYAIGSPVKLDDLVLVTDGSNSLSAVLSAVDPDDYINNESCDLNDLDGEFNVIEKTNIIVKFFKAIIEGLKKIFCA